MTKQKKTVSYRTNATAWAVLTPGEVEHHYVDLVTTHLFRTKTAAKEWLAERKETDQRMGWKWHIKKLTLQVEGEE